MAIKDKTHEARIRALEEGLRLLSDAHDRSTRSAHQLVEHLGCQVIQGADGRTYYVVPKVSIDAARKWWQLW